MSDESDKDRSAGYTSKDGIDEREIEPVRSPEDETAGADRLEEVRQRELVEMKKEIALAPPDIDI